MESINRIRSKLQLVHHPILPLVHVAAETVKDAGLTLAPMGGTIALHDRNEARRKRECGSKRFRDRNVRVQLMSDFLERSGVDWRGAVSERCTASRETLSSVVRAEEALESVGQEQDLDVGEALAETIVDQGLQQVVGASEALAESIIVDQGSERAGSSEINPDENEAAEAEVMEAAENYITNAVEETTLPPLPELPSAHPEIVASRQNNESRTTTTSTSSQPLKKRKITTTTETKSTSKKVKDAELLLPPPTKGSQYTKPEAVQVAQSYPRDSNARGNAMQAMINMGYVPSSKRTIQRLVKLAEEGKPVPNTPWGGSNGGAPPILGNEDIDAIVKRVKEKDARIHGKSDVVEMLVHAARAKALQRGEDPETAKTEFSGGVVHNYMTIFKSKLPARYWA